MLDRPAHAMRIMPRPFTRAQALQNAAFLAILRRTGNVRAAVREMGVHRAMFTRRRARHPAFAAEWDAALAIAHARLQRAADASPAEPVPEPRAIRTRNGRLQLRAHRKGQLTRAAEQAFLAALSATANVRLSAAAAGFSHATFYARARANPGFAREMRLALQWGYDRVEGALLDSFDVAAPRDDGWRHNDLPPVAQVTGGRSSTCSTSTTRLPACGRPVPTTGAAAARPATSNPPAWRCNGRPNAPAMPRTTRSPALRSPNPPAATPTNTRPRSSPRSTRSPAGARPTRPGRPVAPDAASPAAGGSGTGRAGAGEGGITGTQGLPRARSVHPPFVATRSVGNTSPGIPAPSDRPGQTASAGAPAIR